MFVSELQISASNIRNKMKFVSNQIRKFRFVSKLSLHQKRSRGSLDTNRFVSVQIPTQCSFLIFVSIRSETKIRIRFQLATACLETNEISFLVRIKCYLDTKLAYLDTNFFVSKQTHFCITYYIASCSHFLQLPFEFHCSYYKGERYRASQHYRAHLSKAIQYHEDLQGVYLGHMSIHYIMISHCIRDDSGRPFENSIVIVPSLNYIYLCEHWQRERLML